MIKDLKTGGYTAFFIKDTGIIAEGETKRKAYRNLLNAKHDVDMERRRTERDILNNINF